MIGFTIFGYAILAGMGFMIGSMCILALTPSRSEKGVKKLQQKNLDAMERRNELLEEKNASIDSTNHVLQCILERMN